MQTNVIHTADCFEQLKQLDKNSIHAVVTDPPYGLAFMGRDWDDFEPKEYQEWCEKWGREAKRVLKPGGHLLAFSGNRTHHRLFTGIEDAGFEIRDTLTWHYGSGFPKASDISKTIDKREGAEREVIGTSKWDDRGNAWSNDGSHDGWKQPAHETNSYENREVTAPATPEPEKWDGWKTGLKPATEYIVVARKPFDGATVDCVLEHGTGALNIDETRIESGERPERTANSEHSKGEVHKMVTLGSSEATGTTTEGRYPSNVVFDEVEADALDNKVGELETGDIKPHEQKNSSIYFNSDRVTETHNGDSGGPSRYFYTSKASKAERTENGSIENSHPTVKPQDLMEWLVKLVTKENQIVLDPFCGSGTTLKACKELNREFIGIEKQTKWADVARVRVGLTPNNPEVVREDDNQEGLEAYQ